MEASALTHDTKPDDVSASRRRGGRAIRTASIGWSSNVCERLLGPYAAHRKAHDEHSARLRKWNQAWRKRVEAERVRRTNPRGLVSAFPDAVESEEEYVGQWRSERRRWVVGTFNSP